MSRSSTRPDAAGAPPMPTPRVRVVPLLARLFFSLLLPVGLALLVDWLLGTLPWVTLVVGIICIPLASLVVIKAALRDMDRLIAAVAPEHEEQTPEASVDDPSGVGELLPTQAQSRQPG